MRPELDMTLCERYPRIFRDRKARLDETCMARGFECGDGWFVIINELCAKLQYAADCGLIEQPVATQVKEKVGTLRFRYRPFSSYAHDLVAGALALSQESCIFCGAPGVPRYISPGGIIPVCEPHCRHPEFLLSEKPSDLATARVEGDTVDRTQGSFDENRFLY